MSPAETGFYYLNTRYYDPSLRRFVNVDNQLSEDGTFTGFNLFAYCGNNPVMRTDETGEAWWHWAAAAAIVAVCAVAVVVTAGGAAAGLAAVAAVGSGMAASTTASTVAAAAFIGAGTAFGFAALNAASESKSVKDFNRRGNWGTVVATAGAAVVGGGSAYVATRCSFSDSSTSSNSTPSVQTSKGSTGRTKPVNLVEQLAMEQVQSAPLEGTPLSQIQLADSRWPASEGWIKMQQIVHTSQGDINIHYNYNPKLNLFDDFKFKP